MGRSPKQKFSSLLRNTRTKTPYCRSPRLLKVPMGQIPLRQHLLAASDLGTTISSSPESGPSPSKTQTPKLNCPEDSLDLVAEGLSCGAGTTQISSDGRSGQPPLTFNNNKGREVGVLRNAWELLEGVEYHISVRLSLKTSCPTELLMTQCLQENLALNNEIKQLRRSEMALELEITATRDKVSFVSLESAL